MSDVSTGCRALYRLSTIAMALAVPLVLASASSAETVQSSSKPKHVKVLHPAVNKKVKRGDAVTLSPQPLPPGSKNSLSPQPLPPGAKSSLSPQPLPPGAKSSLSPQPLPPKVQGSGINVR